MPSSAYRRFMQKLDLKSSRANSELIKGSSSKAPINGRRRIDVGFSGNPTRSDQNAGPFKL
jgi:hypothetical protein